MAKNSYFSFMELPGSPNELKKNGHTDFLTDLSKKALISRFRCMNYGKLVGQKSILTRFLTLCKKVNTSVKHVHFLVLGEFGAPRIG